MPITIVLIASGKCRKSTIVNAFKAHSHVAIAIFQLATNSLYRIQCKWSHDVIVTAIFTVSATVVRDKGRSAWQGRHAWQGGMHGKWLCMAIGCAWQGGLVGGHAWQGCVHGGKCMRDRRDGHCGGRYLLECILVQLATNSLCRIQCKWSHDVVVTASPTPTQPICCNK